MHVAGDDDDSSAALPELMARLRAGGKPGKARLLRCTRDWLSEN